MSDKKNKTEKKKKSNYQETETPVKKIGLTSKSKSAATLHNPSNYNSTKKQTKMHSTTKKRQIKSVHAENCMNSDNRNHKSTHKDLANHFHNQNIASSIQIRTLKR